jgi:hypothetical protein
MSEGGEPWFYKVTYVNLQLLNNVIIIKTKVLLPQTYVTLQNQGSPPSDIGDLTKPRFSSLRHR